jgi:hypothetical protein
MDGEKLDKIVEECRIQLAQGESIGTIIGRLHSSGLHIIDTIKVVRSACGIGLRAAKDLVESHPSWTNEVTANELLHEESVEVCFRQEDGTAEVLWVEPLGSNVYRLVTLPFFAYGVSWLDVIVAEPEADGRLFFVRVAKSPDTRRCVFWPEPMRKQPC